MSVLTDLQAAREYMAAQLKDIVENPKPTYTVDGQTVKWTEHAAMLADKITTLDKIINELEPYEVLSIGY